LVCCTGCEVAWLDCADRWTLLLCATLLVVRGLDVCTLEARALLAVRCAVTLLRDAALLVRASREPATFVVALAAAASLTGSAPFALTTPFPLKTPARCVAAIAGAP